MNEQQKPQKQIQIKASEEDMKGRYANLAMINHTKEEFIADFLNVVPPSGTLNARVIMSPGHFKRLTKALDENLKKYEEKFGKIEESDQPGNEIGFV